jgi:large subunit ribosomal protein L4
MKVSVINLDNQAVGQIDLNESIFGLEPDVSILHRVVLWQRARKQSGKHKTKGISEISGTTKKPYKQKGTGSARHGSLRSPQFRGGATIFGPLVRSHEHDLPKKVRKLGLKMALSSKLKEGKLIVLDNADLNSYKTATLVNTMAKITNGSSLIIDADNVNQNLLLAASNPRHINVLPQCGANVYDILLHDNLILTKAAVEELVGRLVC